MFACGSQGNISNADVATRGARRLALRIAVPRPRHPNATPSLAVLSALTLEGACVIVLSPSGEPGTGEFDQSANFVRSLFGVIRSTTVAAEKVLPEGDDVVVVVATSHDEATAPTKEDLMAGDEIWSRVCSFRYIDADPSKAVPLHVRICRITGGPGPVRNYLVLDAKTDAPNPDAATLVDLIAAKLREANVWVGLPDTHAGGTLWIELL